MLNWNLSASRDGSHINVDFEAEDDEAAEAEAFKLCCERFRVDPDAYPEGWEDLMADIDGSELCEAIPRPLAEPLPLDTVQLYRRLADGLSDMIEGGRLIEAAIPDDYRWLVEQLAAIVEADPGSPELPPHMLGGDEQPAPAARTFAHLPERCPSKHWNDGTDICADCGTDLQA